MLRRLLAMPRFVILRHELPPESNRPSHWDLMLERDGVLRTWALDALPQPGLDIPAAPLPDHRLAYLDYEGPISNNRGSVARWDAGTYHVGDETPDRLWLEFAGQKLTGSAELSVSARPGSRVSAPPGSALSSASVSAPAGSPPTSASIASLETPAPWTFRLHSAPAGANLP